MKKHVRILADDQNRLWSPTKAMNYEKISELRALKKAKKPMATPQKDQNKKQTKNENLPL